LITAEIEVEQGDVRDAEPVQQPPEVVDVAAAERHDRDGGCVRFEADDAQTTREDNLFAVPFPGHDQPREVQLRVGVQRLTDELVCLVGGLGHHHGRDDRASLRVQP
jgi:hypothetical protein